MHFLHLCLPNFESNYFCSLYQILVSINQAFQALGEKTLSTLQANQKLLTNTLQNHVLFGLSPVMNISEEISSLTSLFRKDHVVYKKAMVYRLTLYS